MAMGIWDPTRRIRRVAVEIRQVLDPNRGGGEEKKKRKREEERERQTEERRREKKLLEMRS